MRSGARESRWITDEDWADMWRRFTTSAFRLEARPSYWTGDDLVEQYTGGRPMPVGFNVPWHNRLRVHRQAGRSVQRVRLVDERLTEYQRCQFEWEYPGNVRSGEDVRVICSRDEVAAELPRQDFWLFDDSTVVLLHHRDDGPVRREPLDGDPAEYVRYAELALAHSTPFRFYPKIG
ncbi:DUF6879 family protein [Saccharothrix longispora]|uniref:DUF6879 family protein n=1 Tax=Saccharothrix longispora TaxID=33920 RepID=UPI0028FD2FAE|nr:DUF6879 family protein [Saccharothrix longispora]MDU0294227.1 hypothetical protein [Saccharothrix longispora]